MKKFLIFILIMTLLLLAAGYFTYLFRYDVFRYSAESLIMKNLPDYVRVDDVNFDVEKGVLEIRGFRILNPPGYAQSYLCEIERFICKYENRGSKLLDGIKVTDITAENPELYIERKSNGINNIQETLTLMQGSSGKARVKPSDKKSERSDAVKGQYAEEAISRNEIVQGNYVKDKILERFSQFNIFDFLELTDLININNGRLLFIDKAFTPAYNISLDAVNGTVRLIFNESYTKMLSMETRGSGIVNGYGDQKVEWVSKLEPETEELTMSNTVIVRNIDIRQFKPYYDEYLPIDIINARGTGDFIVNFDNGNIGSSNTIKLRDFKFSIKDDTSSSKYWQGAFNEVLNYLTSSRGETTFDFKIKGPMDNPAFYPGPYVKKAIQNMVVDKISEVVKSVKDLPAEQGGDSVPAAQGANSGSKNKTDVEKVVDLINILLQDR